MLLFSCNFPGSVASLKRMGSNSPRVLRQWGSEQLV